jgi:integrase
MAWYDKKSRTWRYRYVDDAGVSRIRSGGPSKALAGLAEGKAKDRRYQIEAGLLDPTDTRYVEQGAIHLQRHADDYCQHLRDKGRTYVFAIEGRLPKLFMHGLAVFRDLTTVNVTVALKRYGESGVSEQTVKHALTQLKGMLNWCVEDKRLRANPIAGLRLPKVTKMVHPRRHATPDELLRIIEAAGRTRRSGWSKEDRQALLVVMCGTGLRRGEIVDLMPESFILDSNPRVIVAATETKNSEAAVQPIPLPVVPHLKAWLAGKRAGERCFPAMTRTSRVSRIVYRCCAAAGIPKKTAAGFLDGHALRHTYGTMLAQELNIQDLRVAMRHKDIKTTARYLHEDNKEIRRGANTLMGFLPQPNGGVA